MITYNGLIKLGFDPSEFKISSSVASNRKPYISYWGSDKPQPSVEEIEQAEKVYIAEAQAQAEAKAQLRASVINKIAINLSSEEKAWLEENL
jgi:hypothetical protein